MSDRRKRIKRFRADTFKWERTPPKNAAASILDGLNAMQVMDRVMLHSYDGVRVYGPKSFQAKGCAGVVVWMLPHGYDSYRELVLFGIWAVENEGKTQIIIGTKRLKYTAPVFNAESFWTLIKRGYDTYYDDNRQPPEAGDRLFAVPFDPMRRIALREEIASVVHHWSINHRSD